VRAWRPKRVFFHDIFDGWAINHHEARSLVSRYKASQAHTLDLDKELEGVGREIAAMHNCCKSSELVIVKSNHDEFLSRLLDSADFRDHVRNLGTLYELGARMCEGQEPLKAGVKLPPHVTKKVTWLTRDEDYDVSGTECGHHGDKGSNGSRGSPKQTKMHTGSAVQGHTHTPDRDGDTITNGTSTRLKLNYCVGPSSWMHAHTLIYKNGTKQLVIVADPASFKL
jgi:hypothetical protein